MQDIAWMRIMENESEITSTSNPPLDHPGILYCMSDIQRPRRLWCGAPPASNYNPLAPDW